jgi:hypothetical protein
MEAVHSPPSLVGFADDDGGDDRVGSFPLPLRRYATESSPTPPSADDFAFAKSRKEPRLSGRAKHDSPKAMQGRLDA